MSDETTELQSLSKLKMAGRLRYWRGTIEMPETELHAICDEIQAEYDNAVHALNKAAGNWAKADALLRERTSGTLTAEQVRECVQHVYHEGYSDGSVHRGAHIDETDWQAIADELNAKQGSGTCEACAFSKPTDLTDGCAALERIAELEEECDQLREAVAYWQRMYEEQIGVRR